MGCVVSKEAKEQSASWKDIAQFSANPLTKRVGDKDYPVPKKKKKKRKRRKSVTAAAAVVTNESIDKATEEKVEDDLENNYEKGKDLSKNDNKMTESTSNSRKSGKSKTDFSEVQLTDKTLRLMGSNYSSSNASSQKLSRSVRNWLSGVEKRSNFDESLERSLKSDSRVSQRSQVSQSGTVTPTGEKSRNLEALGK